jgi:hypothetical protein
MFGVQRSTFGVQRSGAVGEGVSFWFDQNGMLSYRCPDCGAGSGDR